MNRVSVPFARGRTSLLIGQANVQAALKGFSPLRAGENFAALCASFEQPKWHVFQSPSRGGELRCGRRATNARPHSPVSVPFARGRTSLRGRNGDIGQCRCRFQSPSRGGELRCTSDQLYDASRDPRFSPLRAGENFAALNVMGDPTLTALGFSPLRAGENFAAYSSSGLTPNAEMFQSPSRGGELRCRTP